MPPTATADPGIKKAPRKQKPFHHARLPMIPATLSLPQRRNRNNSESVTPSTTASNSAGTTSISDTKRGCLSGGSATVWRKRLFSNSLFGRDSASQTLSPQEDKHFVLNPPVDPDHVDGSSLLSQTRSSSPSSSFWDECPPYICSSLGQEYVPQPILSPAELLEIEANMQYALDSERYRDCPMVSSSTVADDNDGSILEELAELYSPYTGSLTPPPRCSRPPSPAHHDNGIKPSSPRLACIKLGEVSVETNLRQNMINRKPSNDGFNRDHQRGVQQDPLPKVNAKQQQIWHDGFLDQAWASLIWDELDMDQEIDELVLSLMEVIPIKDEAEDSRRSQWWRGQEDYPWAQQEHLEQCPSLYSWTQINLNDEGVDVRTQIQGLLRDVVHPWKTVHLLPQSAEVAVMDVLQQVCFL